MVRFGSPRTHVQDGRRQVANELLYRDDEARLEIVEQGRPWSFDGDGGLFRLVSEAQRIRLAHLFDPVLAVHTSVVEPLPHQITAVYEAMLPRQPLRFLLADDPGAGKTIMAGLLIKELIARGDLQRCLIVCPGSLAEQWQDELYRRFHLPFEILTNDKLEAARTGNWFLEANLVIARLDKLSRNEDVQEKLKVPDGRWDLVVCDEAHKMSATVFGGEIKYTKRYRLGQLLSTLTRHFLLMTATPHNGKEEDFQLFMALLDGDRFEGRFRDGVHSSDVSDLMRRMPETYQWLLVPVQSSPQAAIEWQAIRLSGQDSLAVRASKKLRSDELLLTGFAATRLRMELDRVPLWRGNHVAIKQLVEDFGRYLYLPRLRSSAVLTAAIQDGCGLLLWEQDSFAYADRYDEEAVRYRGLRGGKQIALPDADSSGLLVRPDVARKQLEANTPSPGPTAPSPGPTPPGPTPPGPGPIQPQPKQAPKRFHGSVKLEAARAGRDASVIADEVIAHLAGLVGAKVTVTLEIEAEMPGGAPETVVRTVTENSRSLKFTSQGFETE